MLEFDENLLPYSLDDLLVYLMLGVNINWNILLYLGSHPTNKNSK